MLLNVQAAKENSQLFFKRFPRLCGCTSCNRVWTPYNSVRRCYGHVHWGCKHTRTRVVRTMACCRITEENLSKTEEILVIGTLLLYSESVTCSHSIRLKSLPPPLTTWCCAWSRMSSYARTTYSATEAIS